jgi:dephospho-CoA kinase
MLLIGITGGIACGKTEVARVFQRKGTMVISGDQIGRGVVEKNKVVLKQLVKTFGQGILKRDGTLNRRKLGKIAFASNEGRAELNGIVHPHLLKELRRKIDRLKGKRKSAIVVVDAALIVEWGLEKKLDYLIFVESKKEDKIERLQKEKGYSRGEALDRIKSQLPETTKKRKADFVIRNDKGLAELRRKANGIWERIMGSCVE